VITAAGQLLQFSSAPEDGEGIKEVLSKVRNVYHPETNVLTHGGLGSSTRFDIEQFEYGGGNADDSGGYMEVLYIKDAPDGRCPYVIHFYHHWGLAYFSQHTFSEWKTLEDAISARKDYSTFEKDCKNKPGFIRFVDCGELKPWFYAVGNEMLVNDVAVCSGFENHPVYSLGRRFAISSEDGQKKVVTCMGARQYSYQSRDHYERTDNEFYWVIMFSDGSHVHINLNDEIIKGPGYSGSRKKIEAISDGDIWQLDLIKQFREIISGKKLGGTVKFEDGSTLVLKYQPKGKCPPDAPGRYLVHVTAKNGEVSKGWVDFDPAENKGKTVVEMILKATANNPPEKCYVKVEVKKREGDQSRKWLGVWHRLIDRTRS
jgi:hypothetical protein